MTRIEKAVALFVQREGFIRQAPDALTADIASEELEFPGDFVVAARLIADLLQRQVYAYRERAAEWEQT